MRAETRRLLVVLAMIVPVAAVSLLLPDGRPALPAAGISFSVPRRAGDWSGEDVALSARTRELLGTGSVLNRRYRNSSGGGVLVCIVEGLGDRRSVHPPEICYRGWGFEIVGREEIDLPVRADGGSSARLVLLDVQRPGGDRRLVAYGYLTDAGLVPGFLRERIRAVAGRWLGKRVREVLVRFSTPIGQGESREEALERIETLAERLLPPLKTRDVEKNGRSRGGGENSRHPGRVSQPFVAQRVAAPENRGARPDVDSAHHREGRPAGGNDEGTT